MAPDSQLLLIFILSSKEKWVYLHAKTDKDRMMEHILLLLLGLTKNLNE